MDIFLIATLRRDKDILGYRLLDINDNDGNGKFMDVPASQVYQVLKSKKLKINGLKLRTTDNQLMGNNGSVSRYPRITENGLDGKSSLIILEQIVNGDETIAYKVSDYKGKIATTKLTDVVKYAKENGIANGKVVSSDGKEFISSIAGSYKKVQFKGLVKDKTKKDATVDNKDITTKLERVEPIVKREPEDKNVSVEDKIWITVQEFREYMVENDYKYTLLDEAGRLTLSNIDHRLEELKIPVGVNYVDRLTDRGREYSIKKLYIPKTVEDAGYDFIRNMDNLEEIVFQDGIENINLGYPISGSNIKKINIPSSVKSIANLPLTGDVIDLSHTSVENINNSFVPDTKTTVTDIILPDTIKVIKDSFNKIEFKGVVKLGSELTEISNSFTYGSIDGFDLSLCGKLEVIGYDSFKNNDKIQKIDLSNTIVTTIDTRAFSGLKELQEIVFPDTIININHNVCEDCINLDNVVLPYGLEKIGMYAFGNFKQEQIEIPDTVNNIMDNAFSNKTNLKFTGDRQTIRSGTISNTNCNKIILPDSTKVLNSEAFRGSVARSFEIGDRLEEIKGGAFIDTHYLEELDLRHCSNLIRIGDKAFAGSSITKLVLNEGLTRLGSSAFQDCTNLHSVLLPSTIKEFDRAALSGSGSRVLIGTTFYVYDGTVAHNYCKRNRLRFVLIKSLDDFDSYFKQEERVLDERKLAKFRMMLSLSEDTNATKLLEDEYINYVDILLKLSDALKSEQVSHYNIPLDTSKYIDVDVNQVPHLGNTTDVIIEKYSRDYGTDAVFNNLSNLITTTHELMPSALTTKAIDFYDENEVKFELHPIYADDSKCIYYIGLKGDSLRVSNDTSRIYKIIVIVIDGRIKFVSMDTGIKEYRGLRNNLLKSKGFELISNKNEVMTEGIIDYLQVDSIVQKYGTDSIVNNAPVPKGLGKKLFEKILKQWIMLDNKVIKKNMYGRYTGLAEQRFICTVTGKIIETEVRYNWDDPDIVSDTSIRVIQIMDIKNGIHELDGDSIEAVTNCLVELQDTKDLLYKINSGNEYINKLKQQEGAYDEPKSYEFELGNVLNQLKIKTINDVNEAAFNAIVNTGFYVKTTRSIKDIIGEGMGDTIECEDGIHLIVQFRAKRVRKNINILGGNNLIYGVALLDKNNYSKADRAECYVAGKRFSTVLSELLDIGNKEKVTTEDWRVSNSEINIDNYTKIADGCYNYTNEGRVKTYLAIGKVHGNVALIGTLDSNDGVESTMVLLNFKDLESGSYFINKSSETGDYETAHERLADSVPLYLKNGKVRKLYEVDTIRRYIELGYPNGYHVGGKLQSLYDICMKQRSEQ